MGKAKKREEISKSATTSSKSLVKWIALTATALLLGVGVVFALTFRGSARVTR